MKKSGFSLAEVLITMAIIAISASMLIPAYMNVKPDRYKLKVLKCYKVLNEVTEDLISNPDLYFRTPIPEDVSDDWYTANNIYVNNTNILNPNTEWGCNGLACTQMPSVSEFNLNRYENLCKYPNLLLNFMHLDNESECTNPTGREASGVSSNLINWTITINPGNNSNPYSSDTTYVVRVDVNPKNDNSTSSTENCSYSNTCRHPDRFVFNVDASGDITGGDPLTQQYLRNMTNIQKQDDYNAVQNGG